MMKRLLVIVFLLSIGVSLVAQKDYWLRATDSDGNQAFFDQRGNVKIPFGKYEMILSDTLIHFAFVYSPEMGIVAIDQNEQILFKPLIVDNFQPDMPHYGLFRIVENEKIGFANMNGEIILPAHFEAVKSFQDSIAAFCVGCKMEYDELEYGYWSGGKWGFINLKGDTLVKPQYDDLGLWNKHLVVKMKGVVYSIDAKGNIQKPLPTSAKPWFH